ncbi:MAG TPA: TetR/AcrR family transcriptional regulator [Xanthobacteraceae bacterium]|jgi:AcrR family transcriptional regulator|nr:TetR/AcrR family transcriptional regulator [Xanthobacteraceae bacterium]
MAYRRTENVVRRLAARHAAIIAAAATLAAEAGINAVQIGPVSQRAGVATGTVYRYFPSKTELVAALVAAVSERELGEMRRAADAAPGPLSALAGAITTFAARSLANPKLAFALIAEQADGAPDEARLAFRKTLAAEFGERLMIAMRGGHLPDQDPTIAAPALLGALIEGLVGPLAAPADRSNTRDTVQAITLFALRAVGVADARARGLVVQARMPV